MFGTATSYVASSFLCTAMAADTPVGTFLGTTASLELHYPSKDVKISEELIDLLKKYVESNEEFLTNSTTLREVSVLKFLYDLILGHLHTLDSR